MIVEIGIVIIVIIIIVIIIIVIIIIVMIVIIIIIPQLYKLVSSSPNQVNAGLIIYSVCIIYIFFCFPLWFCNCVKLIKLIYVTRGEKKS